MTPNNNDRFLVVTNSPAEKTALIVRTAINAEGVATPKEREYNIAKVSRRLLIERVLRSDTCLNSNVQLSASYTYITAVFTRGLIRGVYHA